MMPGALSGVIAVNAARPARSALPPAASEAGVMPPAGISAANGAAAGFGMQPPAGQATGTAYTVPPWIGRPPGTPASHRMPNTPPTPGKPTGDGTGEPGANFACSCTFTVVTRSDCAMTG